MLRVLRGCRRPPARAATRPRRRSATWPLLVVLAIAGLLAMHGISGHGEELAHHGAAGHTDFDGRAERADLAADPDDHHHEVPCDSCGHDSASLCAFIVLAVLGRAPRTRGSRWVLRDAAHDASWAIWSPDPPVPRFALVPH